MRQLLISRRVILLTTAVLFACSSSGHPSSDAAAPPPVPPTRPGTTTGSSATTQTPPLTTAPTTTIPCADQQEWTTDPQVAVTPPLIHELVYARVGRHECYDRIVFDVNGIVEGPGVVGYDVSYVPEEVTSDPRGEPIPTAGPAALRIVVRAPSEDVDGHQPWRPRAQVGDDLVPADQMRDWGTFTQVTLAGSFEGQSTIAVGLSARLPFRVGAFEDDGGSHVYVDVAHEPLHHQ